MNKIKTPYRIFYNKDMEVYKLPCSYYALLYRGDIYRVVEVQVYKGVIYIQNTPFMDHTQITDAYKHIEYNFSVEYKGIKEGVFKIKNG